MPRTTCTGLFASANRNPNLVKTAFVLVALRQIQTQSEEFSKGEQRKRNADFKKNEDHGMWDLTLLMQFQFHLFEVLRN